MVFIVLTAHSTLLFKVGWLDKPWRIPFHLKKSFISWATNCGLLSETMTSGRPWVANRKRRARMVIDAVVEDIGNNSIHFDFASTTSRNIWPFNGPAKSTCILCHGRVGQIQGLRTFWGVLQLFSRQRWQSCTVCTTPWSRLGHHTCSLARDLMVIIPGWFKCNSDKTTAWYLAGITALLPRGM